MSTMSRFMPALHLLVVIVLVSASAATPAVARVPPKCGPLFTEAGKWNVHTIRDTEKMRALVDGEIDYVTRRWRPATRIELGYLTDQFNQYGAEFMLASVEKAFRCAAPATSECRPLYAQVTVDKLRAKRRLKAARAYLQSFPSSYGDTLVTRRQIIRFAEHFNLALEALLSHQQSSLAAVRCAAPQQ